MKLFCDKYDFLFSSQITLYIFFKLKLYLKALFNLNQPWNLTSIFLSSITLHNQFFVLTSSKLTSIT